jgi:hypothetical protein
MDGTGASKLTVYAKNKILAAEIFHVWSENRTTGT